MLIEVNGYAAPPQSSDRRRGREVTLLLEQARLGDERAIDDLLPAVYEELRGLAARFLAGERRDHTLQPTALVHEAYMQLVGARQARWESRAQFFALAATVIRRILLQHARKRNRARHGGKWRRVRLDDGDLTVEPQDVNLIALDEALSRLGRVAPQKLRVVELRFFTGLSVAETAEALGVSPRTVARDWRIARAWLQCALEGDPLDEP